MLVILGKCRFHLCYITEDHCLNYLLHITQISCVAVSSFLHNLGDIHYRESYLVVFSPSEK
jgi:hypothetical protein